jgi:hypothetical protein
LPERRSEVDEPISVVEAEKACFSVSLVCWDGRELYEQLLRLARVAAVEEDCVYAVANLRNV